jgi:DNA recombination protein Rad52
MTFSPEQITELKKPLDRKNVKPPAPGKHGEYVEGWHVIAEANRIFGFDGWTRETIEICETARVEANGKWNVGYRAKVRITAGGVVREGTGFGSGDGMKNLSDAIESAGKEAETDAMKRALMTFGNPFGLALYDKSKANVADTPAPKITDGQRDLIMTLSQASGVTVQTICEGYNISDLRELPASKYPALEKRLRDTKQRELA